MPETQQKVLPAPVYWAQRANLVYVKVGVEDAKTPEIKVDKDRIYFKAVDVGVGQNKQTYEANLELFDEIKPDESKFMVRDRGTEFVLIKAKEGPFWKRLLKDQQKYHWLKVDFNKWKDEDDTDEEGGQGGGGDFEDMMRQMGGLGGMGGMPGMGGMGGMPGMGGMGGMPGMGGLPDMDDLDDKEEGGPDSDDEELPELEEKDK